MYMNNYATGSKVINFTSEIFTSENLRTSKKIRIGDA